MLVINLSEIEGITGLSSCLQIPCCVVATCLCLGFCVSLPHMHCPVIIILLITCVGEEAQAKCLLKVLQPKLAALSDSWLLSVYLKVCLHFCLSIIVLLISCYFACHSLFAQFLESYASGMCCLNRFSVEKLISPIVEETKSAVIPQSVCNF